MSIHAQRKSQTLLYIILAVLVLALIAGAIVVIVLANRIGQLEAVSDSNGYLTKAITLPPTDAIETLPPTAVPTAVPTETPQPTHTPPPTETPLPTYTPYYTVTPRNTPTRYQTPVFLFNVDEVLYLDSSISAGNFWNPDIPVPLVPEDDRIAILALMKAAQDYREYVWYWEDYSALATYNYGYALEQMTRYYNYYIDPADGCYVDVDVVDEQFHTVITAYDGLTARTMTMKVESRNHICDGVSQRWVPADGYAYEMRLRKFDNGMGGTVWRIIEHPLGSDPSQ